MAKQTFTTGSVLTATQMNNLQANDYNWTVSQKTASYVLAAADAGTRIEMNAAGSTTVTVNTGLFTAGDSLIIQNIGAGVSTITAGTATVNKASGASLALSQYQGGTLYFVSASSAIFYPFDIGASTPSAQSYTLINSPSGTALTGATTINVSLSGSYNFLLIRIDDASSANASSIFTIEPNASASGCTYVTTYYDYNGTSFSTDAASNSGFAIARQGNTAGDTATSYAFMSGISGTGFKYFNSNSRGSGTGGRTYLTTGYRSTADALTSIQIRSSTGNFDAGTMFIYGAN